MRLPRLPACETPSPSTCPGTILGQLSSLSSRPSLRPSTRLFPSTHQHPYFLHLRTANFAPLHPLTSCPPCSKNILKGCSVHANSKSSSLSFEFRPPRLLCPSASYHGRRWHFRANVSGPLAQQQHLRGVTTHSFLKHFPDLASRTVSPRLAPAPVIAPFSTHLRVGTSSPFVYTHFLGDPKRFYGFKYCACAGTVNIYTSSLDLSPVL